MVKSIYLNYQADNQGNKPYKFVVSLDETLKLGKNSEVALHNVELERPIITLDEPESFYILINQNGVLVDTPDNFIDDEFNAALLTPDQVNTYETQLKQQITFQSNPFYNNLVPNIYVEIPAGIYSKNMFLEILQDKANTSLKSFFSEKLPQFYNTYKFAVVNDGSKVFLGLFNECKLQTVKISDATDEMSPDIVNSVNLVDTNISDIVVADFANPPNNLAYPTVNLAGNTQLTYTVNTDKTIELAAAAGNNWNTFAFMNSSVNILNNKQDLLTDRQNSGIQFSLGYDDAGSEEYFVGFLSQSYQQTHWTAKNQPDTVIIEQLNAEVPLAYCGLYFKKDAASGNLFMHVVGTSNPYYAVDTFNNPFLDPPADGRYLCYRNSVTPIEEMNVLYSTVIPESTAVKNKSMFGIEFYYRYSTNSKNLIYKNYFDEISAGLKPSDYQPENFRLYFRVYTTGGIDSKTNNRILFDSRAIDYYFSHEMAIDNYNIVNPTSTNSAVFLNAGLENTRDAAWNTGVSNGLVPFIACKNVADATGGFFNMNMNSTRLCDYENAKVLDDPVYDEIGYYKADPLTQIDITAKYNYLPIGIFSYGFAEVTPLLARILGTSPLATQTSTSAFTGFNPNRFPFDINAELGISQIFTEGNKYHVILKNIPIAASANTAYGVDTSKARRQNIVYTVRQSDLNITNVETNSLTISHYPHMLKYLSLYNNNDINLNSIEVEIRNATTGKYAEEITDCSLEILFNQN